jgi:hypothetical protein
LPSAGDSQSAIIADVVKAARIGDVGGSQNYGVKLLKSAIEPSIITSRLSTMLDSKHP